MGLTLIVGEFQGAHGRQLRVLIHHAREHVKRLRLGRCLRFRRMVTREESIQKETFDGLFEHLDAHGLTICGDILIMPTFLNLDGEGSDIEVLYVPVEETAGA